MEDCDGGDNQQIWSWSAVTNNQHYTDINITRGAAMDQGNLMTYILCLKFRRGSYVACYCVLRLNRPGLVKRFMMKRRLTLHLPPAPGQARSDDAEHLGLI